jgi:hypothetical protein
LDTARALDIHEERVGALNEALQFVLALLMWLTRVQQVVFNLHCDEKWELDKRRKSLKNVPPVSIEEQETRAKKKRVPMIVWFHLSRVSLTKTTNMASNNSFLKHVRWMFRTMLLAIIEKETCQSLAMNFSK